MLNLHDFYGLAMATVMIIVGVSAFFVSLIYTCRDFIWKRKNDALERRIARIRGESDDDA